MPQRASPVQQSLQQALGARPERTEIDEELRALLLPTADFRRPPADPTLKPEVIGSPTLIAAVNDLLSLVPELGGNVRRIQNSPTRSVINDLMRSRIPIQRYRGTNLLGQYSPTDRDIFIEPTNNDLPPLDLASTLAHELAHTVGVGHTRQMSNIEGLARMREDAKHLARKGR